MAVSANEFSVKLKGDTAEFERNLQTALTKLSTDLDAMSRKTDVAFKNFERAGRGIKTVFESAGKWAKDISNDAWFASERFKVLEHSADRAATALRRYNVEQRGGGRIGGVGGTGIGSQVGQGANAYLQGAIGGGVAGLVTTGIGTGINFIEESTRAYVDASRAALLYENAVSHTTLTLESQNQAVSRLSKSYNLSSTEAQAAYGQALRVTSALGKAADTERLFNAAATLAVRAGRPAGDALDIIRAIQSGSDEPLNRVGLPNPSTIYAAYGRQQGIRGTLSYEQQQSAIIDAIQRSGSGGGGDLRRYQASPAGRADYYTAQRANFYTGAGAVFGEVGGAALDIALGRYSQGPLAGAVGLQGKQQDGGPLYKAVVDAANWFSERIKLSGEDFARKTAEAAVSFQLTQEQGTRVGQAQTRLAALAQSGNPLAQIRYQSTVNADELVRQGRERVLREYAEAQSAAAERAQGKAFTDQEISQLIRSGNDPRTGRLVGGTLDARTLQLLGFSNAERDIRLQQASAQIGQGLDARLSGLSARNTARDNPIAAAIAQARQELKQFDEEVKQLDPTFAGKAAQIRQAMVEGNRQQLVGLAVGAFSNISSLYDQYASLETTLGSGGFKTVKGFYGQDVTVPDYGGSALGETRQARSDRKFAEAIQFGNELADAGEDPAVYARRFRLGVGLRPEDLTIDQRQQLQSDIKEQIKEERKNAAAAIEGTGYLKGINEFLTGANPETGSLVTALKNLLVTVLIQNESDKNARLGTPLPVASGDSFGNNF